MSDHMVPQHKLNGRSTDSSQPIFAPSNQNTELHPTASPAQTIEVVTDIQRSTEQTSEPTAQASQAPFIGHDFSRIPILPHLTVSQPDDPAEREADRASQVMRSPNAGNVNSIPTARFPGHDFSKVSVLPQVRPALSLFPPDVQRKCAACEEDQQLMRQVDPTVQRDEAETSASDQGTAVSDGTGEGSIADPQIQAIAQQLEQQLEQQLIPETIQSALGQIDLSGMPSEDASDSSDSASSTPNVYAKLATTPTNQPSNLILRQSSPRQPDPPSTAGSSSASPAAATAGNFLGALAAVPEIKSGLFTLQTLTMGRFAQDWSRLRTGEQIGFVSTTVMIGAGTLTGILSNPAARRFALDQLNGKVLPVPGVNWLHLELNTGSNNLMLGMHVDLGRLLPPSLGFGPSSPGAIGGPPQPEPSPIQRMENDAQAGAEGAISQRIQAASGSGSKLDEGVQQHLEQHLDTDLSSVRIHTDSEADRLSRSVNAVAFTTGQDIFFSSGSYNPTSKEGQHLIAHEVMHTVQQANGAVAGTPTAGGVSISNPSDPFEQEAEQVADQVIRVPNPVPGNLIMRSPQTTNRFTHEMDQSEANYVITVHPVSLIQRDAATPSNAPASSPPTHPYPTTGETATFAGITLTENPDQLREEMIKLVANGLPGRPVLAGIGAPDAFLSMIMLSAPPSVCGEPKEPSYEDCHRREILKTKIVPVLLTVVENLRKEHQTFLDDFIKQAKENTRKTLDANEAETKKEAIRYGITEKLIEHATPLPGGISDNPDAGGPVTLETKYDMDKESPAGKGLQAAAKVLLERRQKIVQLQSEKENHLKWQRDKDDPDHKGMVLVADDDYYALGKEIEEKKKAYNDLRTHLSGQYPVLDKFADLDQDMGGLQELVTKGPGSDVAALIAQKLADTLAKIATSRGGLDEGKVNVWRLPKMVSLTQAQLGLSTDPVKTKLIEEKAKNEQPGMLEGIALLVLNLAALALAGPTGGLSLVVAAGVNAAVAAEHVEEYILQDAMAGSALQKAKTLSQDEPSLLWLAVEIAGVAFDAATAVTTMLKAFKSLAPLVRTAKVAKEGEELDKAYQAIREAANDAKVGERAENIVSKIKDLRQGEDVGLKAVGATKEEIDALKTAAKAGEIEATGEAIGSAVKTAEGGKVTLTKNGHLYSCSSPCEILREKYAEILVKPENESLKKELLDLERRASEASSEVAKGSEQGTKLAEQVKQDAAALDSKFRKAQINQGIKALSSKYKILEDLGLDVAAVERVLAKKNIDHMKGQLLEELMANKVRQMLGDEAGRAALAGEKASAKLEFIEGYRITGADGQQLTDGMIVIRDGEKVQVVTVLESKAGKASSRELRVSRESRKKWLEKLKKNDEAYKHEVAEAVEELRETRSELKNVSSEVIKEKYANEIEDIISKSPLAESGQMRLDVERMEQIGVLIDGQPVKVKAGRPQFMNALPSDVPGTAAESAAESEGLKASTLNLDINQTQLKALAEDIAKSLAEAE